MPALDDIDNVTVADLLTAAMYLLIIPVAIIRIAFFMKTRPNVLLAVDDSVRLEMLLKTGAILSGAFIFVCGSTHLAAAVGLGGSIVHMLLSWATASISLTTGLYFAGNYSRICELLSRIEILPRGQSFREARELEAQRDQARQFKAQQAPVSVAASEVASAINMGCQALHVEIEEGIRAQKDALDMQVEAIHGQLDCHAREVCATSAHVEAVKELRTEELESAIASMAAAQVATHDHVQATRRELDALQHSAKQFQTTFVRLQAAQQKEFAEKCDQLGKAQRQQFVALDAQSKLLLAGQHAWGPRTTRAVLEEQVHELPCVDLSPAQEQASSSRQRGNP